MKQKKLISITGAMALLLGVGMSLQHALNDYGIADNSLSEFMLVQAQTSTPTGETSKNQFRHTMTISCTKPSSSTTTTTTTTVNNSKTKSGTGGVSGGVTGVVTGNLGGSTSNTNGTSTTIVSSTTSNSGSVSITGTKIVCQDGGSEDCVPFDPCAGMY